MPDHLEVRPAAPEGLLNLADAWEAIDAAAEDLADHRGEITGANEGAAIDAFARFLGGWTGSHFIGTFPRADGGGSFRFGIRIAPGADDTPDVITLLTKQ